MKKSLTRKLSLSLLLLSLIGGGVFWFTQIAQGVNRTWDGEGTDGTCGGGVGDGNKWACAANWSGDVAPGASDVAIFDGTSTKNATIAANISVAGISINAGYTGTITQSGSFTVTVGSSNFVQADGTFTGGSGAITMNGSFTLSGGIFTSTTGTLTMVTGTSFTHTAGGTFNHNNGTFKTVLGPPASVSMDVATSEVFYNFLHDTGGRPLSIATGDTLVVLGTLTQNGGIATGTIEARGNVVIGTSATGSTGTILFLVAGDQTITSSGGSSAGLNINKPSGSVSVTGDLVIGGNFTLSLGTFNAPSSTLTMVTGTSFTHTAGGTFNHNNGTFKTVLGPPASVSMDVATSEVFYNFLHDTGGRSLSIATGDTLVVLGTLTQNGTIDTGTIEARGDVVIGSGAGGGTALLSFTGGNTQVYTDQGGNEVNGDITINKTANSVTLASNADWNATNQDLTITSGTLLQRSNYAVATGAVTVGANGTWVNNGTGAVTLGGALANSGLIDFRSNNTCGGTDSILLRSSVNGTQRAWSGAGTFVIRDIDVRDMGGSAAITAYSSTNTSGNGGNWTFNATCPFPIQPKAGLSAGKMNLQSGKFQLQ